MGAGLLGFYQAWTDGVGIWRVNDDPFQTGQDWSPLGYTVDNRVEGTMSVYMTFAGLLMLVGMHALGRIFFRRPTEHWVWLPVIIISICLLFTLTRGAWFGFMVGLMFLVMVRLKKYLPIMLGLIIVGLLAFSSVLPQLRGMVKSTETITGPGFAKHFKQRISRMLSGNDETFAMRIALWNGGWEVFKDYPLTGCGFKCVDLVHSQYPDPTGHIKNLRGMHNNFVQLAVDTGILGLSAWIGIWVGFFGLLYKLAKTQKNNHSEGWLIYGSSASVIAFLAAGIFETNFYDSEVVMLLYFIMALPFTGLERKV
jgi:O-antigen ligase